MVDKLELKKRLDFTELWEIKNKKHRVEYCAKLLRAHYSEDWYLQRIADAIEGKNFHRGGLPSEQVNIGAQVMLAMAKGKTYEEAVNDTAEICGIGRTKVTESFKALKNTGARVSEAFITKNSQNET